MPREVFRFPHQSPARPLPVAICRLLLDALREYRQLCPGPLLRPLHSQFVTVQQFPVLGGSGSKVSWRRKEAAFSTGVGIHPSEDRFVPARKKSLFRSLWHLLRHFLV